MGCRRRRPAARTPLLPCQLLPSQRRGATGLPAAPLHASRGHALLVGPARTNALLCLRLSARAAHLRRMSNPIQAIPVRCGARPCCSNPTRVHAFPANAYPLPSESFLVVSFASRGKAFPLPVFSCRVPFVSFPCFSVLRFSVAHQCRAFPPRFCSWLCRCFALLCELCDALPLLCGTIRFLRFAALCAAFARRPCSYPFHRSAQHFPCGSTRIASRHFSSVPTRFCSRPFFASLFRSASVRCYSWPLPCLSAPFDSVAGLRDAVPMLGESRQCFSIAPRFQSPPFRCVAIPGHSRAYLFAPSLIRRSSALVPSEPLPRSSIQLSAAAMRGESRPCPCGSLPVTSTPLRATRVQAVLFRRDSILFCSQPWLCLATLFRGSSHQCCALPWQLVSALLPR